MWSTLPLFARMEIVPIGLHLIIQLLAQYCLYHLFKSTSSPYNKVVPALLPLILPGVYEIFKRLWGSISLWYSPPQVNKHHLNHFFLQRENFNHFVLDITCLCDTIFAIFRTDEPRVDRWIGDKENEPNKEEGTAIDTDIEDHEDTEDSSSQDSGSGKSDSDTENKTIDEIGNGMVYLINKSFRNLVNIGFRVYVQPVFEFCESCCHSILSKASKLASYIAQCLGLGIKEPTTRLAENPQSEESHPPSPNLQQSRSSPTHSNTNSATASVHADETSDGEMVIEGDDGQIYGWPYLLTDDDLALRFEAALEALPPLLKGCGNRVEKGMS
jgi:hypothetical protein